MDSLVTSSYIRLQIFMSIKDHVKVDNVGNIRTGNFIDTSPQLRDGELNLLPKATLKTRTGKP
jgi:hypothetical protein